MKNKPSALLLAAGFGTRLKPYTDHLPKCLMPIKGIPLLEIWLDQLLRIGIDRILVNTHYKSEDVIEFLNRPKYKNKITSTYEKELLGTAGTLRENYSFFKDTTTLLIHADNLCICDFDDFIHYHDQSRPSDTLITMMSFQTNIPESCGILELDKNGVVVKFHEKVKNPPGNLANAAIYLLEPEVIEWISIYKKNDFSNEVIPHYLGKISSWENKNIMLDIGSPEQWKRAQTFDLNLSSKDSDDWFQNYLVNQIHSQLEVLK
jgi:mannose-1-phosphate guanylyltransferase